MLDSITSTTEIAICHSLKLGWAIDKGLAGWAPGAPATYVAMCHIFYDSIEAFQSGFAPHAQEIMADIPNYTDQTPVIQISDVVVGK